MYIALYFSSYFQKNPHTFYIFYFFEANTLKKMPVKLILLKLRLNQGTIFITMKQRTTLQTLTLYKIDKRQIGKVWPSFYQIKTNQIILFLLL